MRLFGMVLCAWLVVGPALAQQGGPQVAPQVGPQVAPQAAVPPVAGAAPAAAEFVSQARLLEHLVKHSDQLLTEINLVRGGLFMIAPQAYTNQPSPWLRRYVGTALVLPPGMNQSQGTPDFIIGIQVNNFRLWTISLYEAWMQKRVYGAQNTAFAQTFPPAMREYFNALSATYFYIEALRRTYLIRNPLVNCYDRELLVRRLMKLERLAFEIRELMHMIRHNADFGIQMRGECIECRYGSIRINIEAEVPQEFITFPYYARNQLWVPQAMAQRTPVQNFTPAYDLEGWNQRWDLIDQGYIQGYQNSPPPIATPVNPPGQFQGGQLGGFTAPGQAGQPGQPGQPGVGTPTPPGQPGAFQNPQGALNPNRGGQPGAVVPPGQPSAPIAQPPGQGQVVPPGQQPSVPQAPGRPEYQSVPPQVPQNPSDDVVPYRDFNG